VDSRESVVTLKSGLNCRPNNSIHLTTLYPATDAEPYLC
jgi:hypothetical protein